MKRFLLLAVAALTLVGCNNVFEDAGNSSRDVCTMPTLVAGFEDAATRTYVEYSRYLHWHEGDLISAFVGNKMNCQYQFTGKTGDISGELKAIENKTSSGSSFDNIYAVYPYFVDAMMYGRDIYYVFPTIQTYNENSFGKGANVMVAVTESVNNTSLVFKNVGGYLKIKLYGDAIVRSVEISGNNGEIIAGDATLIANFDKVPEVVMDEDYGENLITLDCGSGVKLSNDANNPTEFWFVVPSTTFEDGITIKVTDNEGGTFVKSTSNKIVVERNKIQPMAAIKAEFEAIAKPANNEIWYTSTDGSIVEPYKTNVFGANIVSNTYEEGKGIIKFDGNVTTIGDYAFFCCEGFTSVTIPDSVTEIGTQAFSGCDSLTSVTIGDSVTTIGRWAFESCYSLTSVTIPDSVTTIGDEAFVWCDSLTSVTIGDGVTTIGGGAFSGCDSLKEFKGKFVSDNGRCLIVDGVLNSFAIGCGATDYTIPDSVTTIGDAAFRYCDSLTSVTIPDSVTTIGDEAFRFCDSLTSVTIPDSVTTIGGGAFSGCDSLKEFKGKFASDNGRCLIVDGVLNSFAIGCGAADYTIPDSVTTIGDWAFSYCYSLTSVTIPNSVTTIGYAAFGDCSSLISVYCKATTPPSLGYGAFDYNASNRKIYVPFGCAQTYKTIKYWTLYADDIYDYDYENGDVVDKVPILTLTTESDMMFMDAGGKGEIGYTIENPIKGFSVVAQTSADWITNLTIASNKVTFNVTANKSNEVRKSTITVSYGALCFNVNIIQLPELKNNVIYYTTSDGEIVEPYIKTVFGANIVSNIYKDGQGVIIFDGDVTTIGDWAFAWRNSLTSVTIPDSVTEIGTQAFSSCDSLTNVTIGDSVTTIGRSAFESCDSLTSVTIPDSVTTIGDAAFRECPSLTSVTIGDSVTTIGDRAFYKCTSLTSVTIPDSVTTIGDEAFYDSDSLTEVIIGDGVTTIEARAFYHCSALETLKIGKSIESIGSNAFRHCTSLTTVDVRDLDAWCHLSFLNADDNPVYHAGSLYQNGVLVKMVNIPYSVDRIGSYLFVNCSSLVSVDIPYTVESIDWYAFGGCNNLSSIDIDEGVTYIGQGAFGGTGIKEIKIPESVSTIQKWAFNGCSNLKAVYCKSANPPYAEDPLPGISYTWDAFDGNAEDRIIYVPAGSKETYTGRSGWRAYRDSIVEY